MLAASCPMPVAQEFVLHDMAFDGQINLRKFVLTRKAPLHMVMDQWADSVADQYYDSESCGEDPFAEIPAPILATPSRKPTLQRAEVVERSSPSRPSMQRTSSMTDFPAMSQIDLHVGGQSLARSSLHSLTSSSLRCRKSSIANVSSTFNKNPRHRALPKICASIAKSTYLTLRDFFQAPGIESRALKRDAPCMSGHNIPAPKPHYTFGAPSSVAARRA
ncbi:hypothetical protein DFH06DRAFT_1470928 [Mycena polygramma]|nr:hypothetical protein DFH06DRAFT_1470928 [Mycena polygramma]